MSLISIINLTFSKWVLFRTTRMQFISFFMRPSNHKESLDGFLCVLCFGRSNYHIGLDGHSIFWLKKICRKRLLLKIDEFALNVSSSGVKQMAEVIIYQVIYMPLGIKRLMNWSFTSWSCMLKCLNIKWGQNGVQNHHHLTNCVPEIIPTARKPLSKCGTLI